VDFCLGLSFGEVRVMEFRHNRQTDGHVENIVPRLPATLAWRRNTNKYTV